MQTAALLGGWGCVLVSFFGTGLPLGTPPEKEDPRMAHVAPEDCVLYATWAAMATPKLESPNQTEQLLAEPEVQAFGAALERSVLFAALANARQAGTPNDRAEQIGKTAALWARTLIMRSGAIYLSRLSPQGQGLDIQGALIVHAGDVAAELDRSLAEMLSNPGEPAVEVTIGSNKVHRVTLRGPAPLEITWGTGGGYLMIGLGSKALEEMSERLRAQKEPAWLTQVKATLPVDRRSTVSYVNLKKLIDAFLPLGGPDAQRITAALGLSQLASFQSVTGLDETGMISRTLVTIDGQPRGLLALLDDKGIAAGDLKQIPADVLMAYCISLNARKVYDAVLSGLAEIDPRAAEEAKRGEQQVQMRLGINIPETLGALGSRWTIHISPADGGWMGAALIGEILEKGRLAEVEQQILAKVASQYGDIPDVGRIVKTPFSGQTISHLAPRDPTFSFVLPSWCLTDKRLIVGLNPQAVKSVLLRQPADKSLADIPEVAARLSAGSAPVTVSYYDTPKFFEATYAYAQILLPIMTSATQRSGVPFTFNSAQLPAPRTISKHLRPSVTVTRRTSQGYETETRQTLPGLNVGAAAPVGVALLLPAVQAAREAARRSQANNQIRQQLLGLMNYHDVYQTYPPAYSTSKDGKPLLSWRVAILPFIEHKPLYDQFHLDEPWDSEHNKQFIAQMPAAFRSPSSNAEPGKTVYLGVGGPRGMLPAPGQGRGQRGGVPLSAVIDGTSNTVVVVECSDALATIWTKPEPWVPDEKDPIKGLVGLRPTGFLAGFVDGHTQLIPKTINPEMLRRAFSRDDGQPIEWPDDNPRAVPNRAQRP